MTTMMTTGRSAGTGRHPLRTTPTGRPEACACGQELDTCSGHHCPRCGTSIAARAA